MWLYKGDIRNPCEDGNALYHDRTDVSILVVKLCNSFARCYHWRKLGKGHNGISLYHFLQLHVKLQLSQNKNKSIILKSKLALLCLN